MSCRAFAAGSAAIWHCSKKDSVGAQGELNGEATDDFSAVRKNKLTTTLKRLFLVQRNSPIQGPGSTSRVLCEPPQWPPWQNTDTDLFISARKTWSRKWDDDWDGQHPPDKESKDWMQRKIPTKKSSDSKDGKSENNGIALGDGGTGGTGAKKDQNPASAGEEDVQSPPSIYKKSAPAPTVRHIFMIRHGQYNLDDSSNNGLTELGREQSRKTGQRLRAYADGLKKDHYGEIKVSWKKLYCSDMTRAKETANIISEELGVKVDCYDPLLNEGTPCLTSPSGSTLEEVEKSSRHSKLLSDPPRIEAAFRKYVKRKQNWKKLKERVERDAKKEEINEAYSGPQAEEKELSDKDDGKVKHEFEIIVCHMNVIRYFVVRALQLPPEAWLRFRGDNCGLTEIIVYEDGRISLGRFADQGHLAIEETTFH